MSARLRVGLIGIGGISKCIIENQKQFSESIEVVSILIRDKLRAGDQSNDYEGIVFCESFDEFLATKPDVIAECAGHEAVRSHGVDVLKAGVDLVVISIGALADESLYMDLLSAAKKSGAQLHLPAGAVGAIDALSSARLGGLTSVRYRARKPAMAWSGTPAAENVDLAALTEVTVIFAGTAREAAINFPKNSNVACTIALAGIGLDETIVELIADPGATQNLHELEVEGIVGKISTTLCGYPSAANPKTSALTAFSVLKCLGDMRAPIVI